MANLLWREILSPYGILYIIHVNSDLHLHFTMNSLQLFVYVYCNSEVFHQNNTSKQRYIELIIVFINISLKSLL